MKKKLLLELARHLEDGKLGHKRFDFSTYNSIFKVPPHKRNVCGTAGCAIGELPILFPNKWNFDKEYGTPYLKDKFPEEEHEVDDDVQQFFGLEYEEVLHLFYPNRQNVGEYGGFNLDEDATRYQVASNIRDFIAVKESK